MDARCDWRIFLVVCCIFCAKEVGATSSKVILVRPVTVLTDWISYNAGKTYA